MKTELEHHYCSSSCSG